VVHVNQEQQISGLGVGGKVVEFRTGKTIDYTFMDLSGAYPGKELKKWQRHLILSKPAITVVLDDITAKKGDDINIRFHSDCRIEPAGKITLLAGQSGLMALIPVIESPWKFATGEHNLNPKYPNWDDWYAPFEDLMRPYLDVKIAARQDRTIAATIIIAVDDLRQAQMTAASASLSKISDGGFRLIFDCDGKSSEFIFENTDKGLLLKTGNSGNN
jgi:hypothetical protein